MKLSTCQFVKGWEREEIAEAGNGPVQREHFQETLFGAGSTPNSSANLADAANALIPGRGCWPVTWASQAKSSPSVAFGLKFGQVA
ncbi:MAG TPA: hypothetical protein VME17_19895 [Bryobacteraceae bacterium]|nr:hypothetical protein [Bryobacteraceae bacterium]